MAKNVNNKYPADKAGSKYSEFRNTKRVPPGKAKVDVKSSAGQEAGAGKKS
jgi:hypothetical protein